MVRMVRTGTGVLLAALLLAVPVSAGDKEHEDLKREVEALKQGQQEILKQLDQLKKQIQARPAAPAGPNVKDVVFSLGANPVQGAATAKLTLVEFTDYQ